MKPVIKSSRVIIINSILMLCLIAFLIAQNIYFLEKNNSMLSHINENYNRKLDVVMLMSKVVRQRSLQMVTMYLSDDAWEQDKIFTDYHKLKLVFLELRDELTTLGLMNNEKILFDQIMTIINKTEVIQVAIVERIQSGGDNKVRLDISKKDLPLEMNILGIFDSLIEIIRNNANTARKEAKQQYLDIINFVASIAVIIILIAIYLIKRSLSQIVKIESGLIHKAETLSWDATHDALTNVYNRRWLQHEFELLKDEQNAELTIHSLLYIDLDEFKPINDTYGHVAGDNFLCGITRELEQCIRQNDTLARMGGDEFAILLENCDVEKASTIAECLILRVKRFSLSVDENIVSIAGCSIGVNAFLGSNPVFSEIVKQADSACYNAKNNGKNQFYIFSS